MSDVWWTSGAAEPTADDLGKSAVDVSFEDSEATEEEDHGLLG